MRRYFFIILAVIIGFFVTHDVAKSLSRDSLTIAMSGKVVAQKSERKSGSGVDSGKRSDISSTLAWKNEKQKARCEANKDNLRETLLKARDFAFQGDSCAASDYAKEFLALVETSKRECPAEFLEKHGFTSRVIKNLRAIHELGKKRCRRRYLEH
ncbi:MAG: hypothetical protein JRG73_18980 [Deltaproteobacteria bacterium]|nr:hypothetical protein [Deltaproteobacteria bacterium]